MAKQKNIFNSRHPNVLAFIQTTYIRELFELNPDIPDEKLLDILENASDEDIEQMLDICVAHRLKKLM